jgi:hypothetical protein
VSAQRRGTEPPRAKAQHSMRLLCLLLVALRLAAVVALSAAHELHTPPVDAVGNNSGSVAGKGTDDDGTGDTHTLTTILILIVLHC